MFYNLGNYYVVGTYVFVGVYLKKNLFIFFKLALSITNVNLKL